MRVSWYSKTVLRIEAQQVGAAAPGRVKGYLFTKLHIAEWTIAIYCSILQYIAIYWNIIFL
jgi:hypothetical protein